MSVPPPVISDEVRAAFDDLFGLVKWLPDIQATLSMTESEAEHGATRELEIRRTAMCTVCDGRRGATPSDVAQPCSGCEGAGLRSITQAGFQIKSLCGTCSGIGYRIANPCGSCRGFGLAGIDLTVVINVPPGAEHGTTLRIEGEGNALPDGTRGVVLVYLVVGDRPDTRDSDLRAAIARMMIEPNMPRAVVRSPRGPVLSPPLILGLVIGVVMLLLSLLR